jgi:hypothetical protein
MTGDSSTDKVQALLNSEDWSHVNQGLKLVDAMDDITVITKLLDDKEALNEAPYFALVHAELMIMGSRGDALIELDLSSIPSLPRFPLGMEDLSSLESLTVGSLNDLPDMTPIQKLLTNLAVLDAFTAELVIKCDDIVENWEYEVGDIPKKGDFTTFNYIENITDFLMSMTLKCDADFFTWISLVQDTPTLRGKPPHFDQQSELAIYGMTDDGDDLAFNVPIVDWDVGSLKIKDYEYRTKVDGAFAALQQAVEEKGYSLSESGSGRCGLLDNEWRSEWTHLSVEFGGMRGEYNSSVISQIQFELKGIQDE